MSVFWTIVLVVVAVFITICVMVNIAEAREKKRRRSRSSGEILGDLAQQVISAAGEKIGEKIRKKMDGDK